MPSILRFGIRWYPRSETSQGRVREAAVAAARVRELAAYKGSARQSRRGREVFRGHRISIRLKSRWLATGGTS
jgi:hypothetical protein